MNNSFFPLLIPFFIFIVGCSSKESKKFSVNGLQEVDNFGNKVVSYYPTGEIKIAVDTLKGVVFGNRYEFFRDGNLKMFSFQVDSRNNTYALHFDTLGNIILKQGSPFVYIDISFDDAPDTMVVNYYISTYLVKTVQLEISCNDFENKIVKLEDHCCISELKYLKYNYPIKGKNRIQLFSKLTGIDDYGNTEVFYDTIDFTRRSSIK